MIISDQFGPQYDSTDGTIGSLRLVKRYVLVNHVGMIQAKQGRYTFEGREECQKLCDTFLSNYPEDSDKHIYVKGLHVEEWWCYPEHFDPIGPTGN